MAATLDEEAVTDTSIFTYFKTLKHIAEKYTKSDILTDDLDLSTMCIVKNNGVHIDESEFQEFMEDPEGFLNLPECSVDPFEDNETKEAFNRTYIVKAIKSQLKTRITEDYEDVDGEVSDVESIGSSSTSVCDSADEDNEQDEVELLAQENSTPSEGGSSFDDCDYGCIDKSGTVVRRLDSLSDLESYMSSPGRSLSPSTRCQTSEIACSNHDGVSATNDVPSGRFENGHIAEIIQLPRNYFRNSSKVAQTRRNDAAKLTHWCFNKRQGTSSYHGKDNIVSGKHKTSIAESCKEDQSENRCDPKVALPKTMRRITPVQVEEINKTLTITSAFKAEGEDLNTGKALSELVKSCDVLTVLNESPPLPQSSKTLDKNYKSPNCVARVARPSSPSRPKLFDDMKVEYPEGCLSPAAQRCLPSSTDAFERPYNSSPKSVKEIILELQGSAEKPRLPKYEVGDRKYMREKVADNHDQLKGSSSQIHEPYLFKDVLNESVEVERSFPVLVGKKQSHETIKIPMPSPSLFTECQGNIKHRPDVKKPSGDLLRNTHVASINSPRQSPSRNQCMTTEQGIDTLRNTIVNMSPQRIMGSDFEEAKLECRKKAVNSPTAWKDGVPHQRFSSPQAFFKIIKKKRECMQKYAEGVVGSFNSGHHPVKEDVQCSPPRQRGQEAREFKNEMDREGVVPNSGSIAQFYQSHHVKTNSPSSGNEECRRLSSNQVKENSSHSDQSCFFQDEEHKKLELKRTEVICCQLVEEKNPEEIVTSPVSSSSLQINHEENIQHKLQESSNMSSSNIHMPASIGSQEKSLNRGHRINTQQGIATINKTVVSLCSFKEPNINEEPCMERGNDILNSPSAIKDTATHQRFSSPQAFFKIIKERKEWQKAAEAGVSPRDNAQNPRKGDRHWSSPNQQSRSQMTYSKRGEHKTPQSHQSSVHCETSATIGEEPKRDQMADRFTRKGATTSTPTKQSSRARLALDISCIPGSNDALKDGSNNGPQSDSVEDGGKAHGMNHITVSPNKIRNHQKDHEAHFETKSHINCNTCVPERNTKHTVTKCWSAKALGHETAPPSRFGATSVIKENVLPFSENSPKSPHCKGGRTTQLHVSDDALSKKIHCESTSLNTKHNSFCSPSHKQTRLGCEGKCGARKDVTVSPINGYYANDEKEEDEDTFIMVPVRSPFAKRHTSTDMSFTGYSSALSSKLTPKWPQKDPCSTTELTGKDLASGRSGTQGSKLQISKLHSLEPPPPKRRRNDSSSMENSVKMSLTPGKVDGVSGNSVGRRFFTGHSSVHFARTSRKRGETHGIISLVRSPAGASLRAMSSDQSLRSKHSSPVPTANSVTTTPSAANSQNSQYMPDCWNWSLSQKAISPSVSAMLGVYEMNDSDCSDGDTEETKPSPQKQTVTVVDQDRTSRQEAAKGTTNSRSKPCLGTYSDSSVCFGPGKCDKTFCFFCLGADK